MSESLRKKASVLSSISIKKTAKPVSASPTRISALSIIYNEESKTDLHEEARESLEETYKKEKGLTKEVQERLDFMTNMNDSIRKQIALLKNQKTSLSEILENEKALQRRLELESERIKQQIKQSEEKLSLEQARTSSLLQNFTKEVESETDGIRNLVASLVDSVNLRNEFTEKLHNVYEYAKDSKSKIMKQKAAMNNNYSTSASNLSTSQSGLGILQEIPVEEANLIAIPKQVDNSKENSQTSLDGSILQYDDIAPPPIIDNN